jgi:GNAT superfamily N-acetyltransferase
LGTSGLKISDFRGRLTNAGLSEFGLQANILDSAGNQAGELVRRVYDETVYNSLLKLDPKYQGMGFGQNFSAMSEELYRLLGIKKIFLTAGLDKGPYTWAKAGYQWSQSPYNVKYRIDSMIQAGGRPENELRILEDLAERFNLEFGAKGYPTPKEIADISILNSQGVKLGKEIFSESAGWSAVKYLENVPVNKELSRQLYSVVQEAAKLSGIDIMDLIPRFKNGGMFRTPYAQGGLAMLHDKEFVMNAGAVKDYGVNNLRAMNNGTYNSGSVYNSYGVNINVGGSNSNANDIARTVIREIKRLDSQNIRSTKV